MPKYETTLDDIKKRDADGIFLGGTYTDAANEFVIAHRDRRWLLEYIEDLVTERRPQYEAVWVCANSHARGADPDCMVCYPIRNMEKSE